MKIKSEGVATFNYIVWPEKNDWKWRIYDGFLKFENQNVKIEYSSNIGFLNLGVLNRIFLHCLITRDKKIISLKD